MDQEESLESPHEKSNTNDAKKPLKRVLRSAKDSKSAKKTKA